MKTKNILMSILLVMGAIAAKANGFPPELALVSQPVMVYNYNSITVYYDVENIGDYTYRGDICIYLDPDDGYSYAEKYVKVRPGRIKRIAVEIPSYRIDRHFTYTIMPYYTVGRELYSFTTFEYFEPIYFSWHGTRTEPWVVITVGPRVRYYHRPGAYRYYYDGFRPPMPPHGHGPGMPPPMDPMHHTYGYHHNNGGYPATHNDWSEPSHNESAPTATVRPKTNGEGSMSSGSNNGNSSTVTPNNGSSSSVINNGASNSGRTNNTSGTSASSATSGRTGNGISTRPTTNSGRTGNSSVNRSSNSNSSRPSGTSNSSSGRVNSSSSNTRTSGTSNSSSGRVNNSSSNTRSSGSTSTRSSSSSSSNRSGSSSTRSSSSSNSSSSSRSGSATSSGRR